MVQEALLQLIEFCRLLRARRPMAGRRPSAAQSQAMAQLQMIGQVVCGASDQVAGARSRCADKASLRARLQAPPMEASFIEEDAGMGEDAAVEGGPMLGRRCGRASTDLASSSASGRLAAMPGSTRPTPDFEPGRAACRIGRLNNRALKKRRSLPISSASELVARSCRVRTQCRSSPVHWVPITRHLISFRAAAAIR